MVSKWIRRWFLEEVVKDLLLLCTWCEDLTQYACKWWYAHCCLCKSLGIAALDFPLSRHAPLGTKRPAKAIKTFSIHEQIEWEGLRWFGQCRNDPSRTACWNLSSGKGSLDYFQLVYFLVVNIAISALNNLTSVPIEYVPSFNDSDRKF